MALLPITAARVNALFAGPLRQGLEEMLRRNRQPLWLVGGTVRDLLLGRPPADIDVSVVKGARQWARELAGLSGGTFVQLGREEDAARVALAGLNIDVAALRKGAPTIESELALRDLSINALALRVDELLTGTFPVADDTPLVPVDAVGGMADLEAGLIRMAGPLSFQHDPLRMVRVFRFGACLGFRIDAATLAAVSHERQRLADIAAERVGYEMHQLMASDSAWPMIRAMADSGLLTEVIPELSRAVGMEQPPSHHLDVFEHSLEALRQVELMLCQGRPLGRACEPWVRQWLQVADNRRLLKWATLLHDIGKPETHDIRGEEQRITFHRHDLAGAALFSSMARRLRWSRNDSDRLATFISGHMRPFHLTNVARKEELSTRACIRLLRTFADDLPGLLLLAMADARAGKGPGRPEAMETELIALSTRLYEVREELVLPVKKAPPLLTGHDLRAVFDLKPGPRFGCLLEEVEEQRMEGRITCREEALAVVRRLLEETGEINTSRGRQG
ncbi:MAG: polynucleotide adenylyltransferase [Desulfobulbus propionicus]|nr:MAG: polynucleotide adenylyltransferase [Desulfobulbus propionicus]